MVFLKSIAKTAYDNSFAKHVFNFLQNYQDNFQKSRMRGKPYRFHQPLKPSFYRRKSGKKRQVFRKKAYSKRRVPVNLRRYVSNLVSRQSKLNRSLRIERTTYHTQVLAAKNAINHQGLDIPSLATLAAAVSNLKYFNPSAPGTLITVDLDAGTYPQNIKMRFSQRITMVNNFMVPVKVELYYCKCKMDTDISCHSALTNGLADNPTGGLSITTYNCFPSDSQQLHDLYNVKKVSSRIINPGGKVSHTVGTNWFKFDPALFDNHGLEYQPGIHSGGFIIRVSGMLSHDKTTTTEVGLAACGVDVQRYNVISIEYDSAGVKIKDYEVANTFGTQAAGPLVGVRPIPDNIEYSAT